MTRRSSTARSRRPSRPRPGAPLRRDRLQAMAKDPHHLEAPIKAVIDATNQGDSKAFVAAFSKDGAVNDWGQLHTGRGEIGTWDRAENTGLQTKLKVTGVSRLAGEVLVLVQITRGEKVETGTWSFRLKGQSVVSLEIG